MKADYCPALQPRGVSTLRCGHSDCRYCTPRTDSCDYLLIEFRPRGCPPTPDCPHYAPAGRLRAGTGDALSARIQAYADMGWSTRQIARRLRLCENAVRQARGRPAALKNCEIAEKTGAGGPDMP